MACSLDRLAAQKQPPRLPLTIGAVLQNEIDL